MSYRRRDLYAPSTHTTFMEILWPISRLIDR